MIGRILDSTGVPWEGGKIVGKTERLSAGRFAASRPSIEFRFKRLSARESKRLDGLLTVGRGQRVGIFGGSGVGKSTLIGIMTRNTEADITVVGLVGERGREVREFVESALWAGKDSHVPL